MESAKEYIEKNKVQNYSRVFLAGVIKEVFMVEVVL
jgi:hypothetical protein